MKWRNEYAKTCHHLVDGHCRRKLRDFLLPTAWQTVGQQSNGWLNNTFTNSLLGALIFFLLSLLLAKHISAVIKQIEEKLSEVSLTYLFIWSDRGNHRVNIRCDYFNATVQYEYTSC